MNIERINILNFDYNNLDNKATVCRKCNYHYKNKYDPAYEIGYGKGREQYLNKVREFIKNRRIEKQNQSDSMKTLFHNLIIR